MANPLVAQGVLNRLKASVIWFALPSLNVTAPYLGKEGIRLALQGDATTPLQTMTGAAMSPEPFQLVSLAIPLLKTQQLADLYKRRQETDSTLGDCTVRPDVVAGGIGVYELSNCSIQNVGELNFAGQDPIWGVSIVGIYNINANLWN